MLIGQKAVPTPRCLTITPASVGVLKFWSVQEKDSLILTRVNASVPRPDQSAPRLNTMMSAHANVIATIHRQAVHTRRYLTATSANVAVLKSSSVPVDSSLIQRRATVNVHLKSPNALRHRITMVTPASVSADTNQKLVPTHRFTMTTCVSVAVPNT